MNDMKKEFESFIMKVNSDIITMFDGKYFRKLSENLLNLFANPDIKEIKIKYTGNQRFANEMNILDYSEIQYIMDFLETQGFTKVDYKSFEKYSVAIISRD